MDNNKVILSLIWKEWHEQRWKLAFGCVLLMSLALIGLQARLTRDEGIVALTMALGGVLLPIFVAMGLVASERAEGTFTTLMSMPVRPHTVFAVKLVIGAALTAMPLVGAAAVTLLVAGNREMATSMIVRVYIVGIVLAAMTMIWTVCLGVRQPTEARTGMIGLGVLVFWGLTVVALATVSPRPEDLVSAFHPIGVLLWASTDAALQSHILPVVLIQSFYIFLLLVWAGHRIGRPGRTRQ